MALRKPLADSLLADSLLADSLLHLIPSPFTSPHLIVPHPRMSPLNPHPPASPP